MVHIVTILDMILEYIPSIYKTITIGAGGVAQEVEFRTHKREALSSHPSNAPKEADNKMIQQVTLAVGPTHMYPGSCLHQEAMEWMVMVVHACNPNTWEAETGGS
jgi:hypothetical protein